MTDTPSVSLRTLGNEAIADVFAELIRLAKTAEDEKVKLAAIKEVLDRMYGKAGAGGAADAPADGGPEIITGVPRNED